MGYRYRIGADNRIAWVSDEWLGFAADNEAPELTRDRVVGQSVFSFVWGAETEYLYYLLLDEVRTRQRPLSVPFCCDGPSVRRSMRLLLTPLEAGGVELEGKLLWEEPRARVLLFDPSTPRSDDVLTICSWCKKLLVGRQWLDAEAAIERLDLFAAPGLPRQNHGVCPACSREVREVVEAGYG